MRVRQVHAPVKDVDAPARCKHERWDLHYGVALQWHVSNANLGVFGFDLVAARGLAVHAAALEQDAGEYEIVGAGAVLVPEE
jgi:hypothetical protein